jgi:hypothetical protein
MAYEQVNRDSCKTWTTFYPNKLHFISIEILLPPRSNGKPEAATAVDKLLMMGKRMPETC